VRLFFDDRQVADAPVWEIHNDFARHGAVIGERGLPTFVVMEGGYAVADLGGNLVAFLSGFDRGRVDRARD
jgi:acetoin utilization deacetylase AcuC-like enzyme